MLRDDPGSIHNSSDGGVAGKHPESDPFQFLAAPSTSNELNTARLRLIPIACWRVDDVRFAFDSSFVTPDIAAELQLLVALREAHKRVDAAFPQAQFPPLTVFGHADPIGTDDYNKSLSGRRATAVYALLISNTDSGAAVKLWQEIAGVERWSSDQRQTMQATTGLAQGVSDSTLFAAYMRKLSPPAMQIARTDFLGRGADAGGKGDYQGCSEFNPLLIFSQKEEDGFSHSSDNTARNMANSTNRRVVVLLFRPGSRILPSKWPCPRAKEGTAGCIQRFWSDGKKRRSTHLSDKQRKFQESHDTFACRFYQRLTDQSPCERQLSSFRIKLFDKLGQPMPNAPYTATGGVPVEGATLADGTIVLSEVVIPSICTVTWRHANKPSQDTPDTAAPVTDFEFSMSVFVDTDGPHAGAVKFADDSLDDKQLAAQRKLHNLGFSMGDSLADNIRFFQREFGALETGQLADIQDVLDQRHSASAPPSRYKGVQGAVLPPAPPTPAGPPPNDPIPQANDEEFD